ncbi:hypothetical protein PS685_05364 [Pseudomonas fluorescens]|uniref:Uncharacterized protein n=1 Tax=Pseudomonas fluorescens TaxID=294 RepID=A0A5E7ANR5_PSEFL|nr:hypothetical protein PS685_05364 [Pseudomonas fluorescens]
MMPNWSLSIHDQIFAETMVGIAQGIRIIARTRERPVNLMLSSNATNSPSTTSSPTDTTVKCKVLRTAFHH